MCWKEGGGDSCPLLRRGRERGSLFNFGQLSIWISSRESLIITLLLLQMVFSSGRSHKCKTLNLGRVILVVSIPSSSFSLSLASPIISSTCLQNLTLICSRLRRCSSNPSGSNFFILEHKNKWIILRQEKVSDGTHANAAFSFLNKMRKLSKHTSSNFSRVWRRGRVQEEEKERTCSIPLLSCTLMHCNLLVCLKDGTSHKLLKLSHILISRNCRSSGSTKDSSPLLPVFLSTYNKA